ncbi:ATP-dependent helicase [Candidatus Pacearchaeota archaeon ex4484_31]|nr:MAG: ATP-dependent helicase [Candidatus Pacearchaeota archaeon ex4484_31]
MIKEARKRSKAEILKVLDPTVKEWFFSCFKDFSLPQLYGVMPIHERKNILISAPTGGTKTLTAFLSILNYLVKLAKEKKLEDKVYCIYVSPLRALSNDIHVNLERPLAEIEEIARKKGVKMQKIRVMVRTGDTLSKEKARMLKKPPHILITTPETLGIVLSSKRFIEKLKAVEFVIVDEIHALACNKRGVHLSLSLERLEEISSISPVRIGLSATIAPLDEVAKFLVGYEKKNSKWEERSCLIADVRFAKKMDLKVLCPVPNLIDTTAKEMQENLYSLLDRLIQTHKTTLIFTNTRSGTERVINHLKEMFPHHYARLEESIGAHHSSLSRSLRLRIEQKLREGKLKAVVSSTSLELGIDIGYIDLVVLLGSPKSVARLLQRQGRSGHRLHETSKGRLIVLDRDDLVECAVMLKEAIEKRIDKVQIPKNCLDVLAQHIYGMAIQKKWKIDELYDVIRRSYCYNTLSREDFLSVISYLSAQYPGLEEKKVFAKIWYDPETREIGRRSKLARMIYMTNIGTIPEESYVNVIIALPYERKNEKIGMIDEAFLERLHKGDVFVLGGNKYEFLYARGMNAYVNASVKKPPTIPSWFSEMLPLSFDLALSIQHFRKLVFELFRKRKSEKEIKNFISKYLYVDRNSVNAIYQYFYEQFYYTNGKVPDENCIVIEKYIEGEKIYYIFHSLYGRRVNDALSRAIAYLLARHYRKDVEVSINDNGFFIASYRKLNVEKAIKWLSQNHNQLRNVLEEAIEKTEVFRRRFRHCATRALMILRSYKGKSKTVGRQQLKADFLLGAVKKISSEFPILKETKREILEDLMDVENAEKVLKWIKEGKIKIEIIATELPSPFALNLVTQGYADLMKIENKIEFLRRMHQKILKKIKS